MTGVVGYLVGNNGVGSYASYYYGAGAASTAKTINDAQTGSLHGTWCTP